MSKLQTQAELALALGLSGDDRTVRRWLARGMPPAGPDGYDVAACRLWAEQNVKGYAVRHADDQGGDIGALLDSLIVEWLRPLLQPGDALQAILSEYTPKQRNEIAIDLAHHLRDACEWEFRRVASVSRLEDLLPRLGLKYTFKQLHAMTHDIVTADENDVYHRRTKRETTNALKQLRNVRDRNERAK